jgi:hypothetical protein
MLMPCAYYGHAAGCGEQGCHAFCPAVFHLLYAVPIVVESVERMSSPEIPIIAVKSAYSIKSCPLSSDRSCSASTLANRDALNVNIVSLSLALDERFGGGQTFRPPSDELQLRLEVAEESSNLRADRPDRHHRAHRDDPDEEPILD